MSLNYVQVIMYYLFNSNFVGDSHSQMQNMHMNMSPCIWLTKIPTTGKFDNDEGKPIIFN